MRLFSFLFGKKEPPSTGSTHSGQMVPEPVKVAEPLPETNAPPIAPVPDEETKVSTAQQSALNKELVKAVTDVVCGRETDSHVDRVRELLAAGADPNYAPPGGGALQYAVARDALRVVEVLLQAGADPNKETLLFDAGTGPKSAKLMELLLAAGADVNRREYGGGPTILEKLERAKSEAVHDTEYVKASDRREWVESCLRVVGRYATSSGTATRGSGKQAKDEIEEVRLTRNHHLAVVAGKGLWFDCPNCRENTFYSVTKTNAEGTSVRCPKCQREVTIVWV